jgi:transposase
LSSARPCSITSLNIDRSKPHNLKVREWLAAHPWWTFHFTPTSASWLNAVEGFFAKLTKRRLACGVFHSIDKLKDAIDRFTAENNLDPRPFQWTKKPHEILAAVKSGHQVLDSIH